MRCAVWRPGVRCVSALALVCFAVGCGSGSPSGAAGGTPTDAGRGDEGASVDAAVFHSAHRQDVRSGMDKTSTPADPRALPGAGSRER